MGETGEGRPKEGLPSEVGVGWKLEVGDGRAPWAWLPELKEGIRRDFFLPKGARGLTGWFPELKEGMRRDFFRA